MLRIYYADLIPPEIRVDCLLSDYRIERMKKTRSEKKHRDGLCAELLLDYAAQDLISDISLPLDIVCGEYGKPALRSGEFEFNISHSGDLVAVAVSDMPLGLDIQTPKPCNIRLAIRFFSADEAAALEQSTDKGAYFTKLWCCKESYIKALGSGLSAGLSTFSVINMPGIWHDRIENCHFAVCIPGQCNVRPDMIKKVELL